MYVKRCPWLGFNLGFGPFRKVEYEDGQVSARYCGRNTSYEDGVCVPSKTTHPCETVSFVQHLYDPPLHSRVKEGRCHVMGCSFDRAKNACTDDRECQVNLDRNKCASNNPNCEWDVMRCTIRSNRDHPSPLRTSCDGTEVQPHELCADGASYNEMRRMCEA